MDKQEALHVDVCTFYLRLLLAINNCAPDNVPLYCHLFFFLIFEVISIFHFY
jgi:hypothetical protein